LAPLFTVRMVFLIVFTLMFMVLSKLHRLDAIGTLSLLLMIYLGVIRYAL